MMKNIKHNAAQVAAPSNLSSSRSDCFLRVCWWKTSTARTMKHLLVVLTVWTRRIQMMEGVKRDRKRGEIVGLKVNVCKQGGAEEREDFEVLSC